MKYTFIVDTNKYSGNFEREMCAYITGQVGECGVGDYLVDENISPLFEAIIDQRPDEDGCYRPCAICPTAGRWNNGVGVHFDDDQYQGGRKYEAYESVAIYFTGDQIPHIALMKERAEQFAEMVRKGYYKQIGWMNPPEPSFKITGFRIVAEHPPKQETITGWDCTYG